MLWTHKDRSARKRWPGFGIRNVFAEVPVRVEYALSPDGETLSPVLNSMSAWGAARTGN
ncbi:winged helix-turn-helix transcriptional regulator [Marivita sp. S0852]|uniref:winged helix-turn-helix transcriptional regulator n=1 Tax=Marivita sp. S0852 TaxID=3373893 RepID=UPI003981DAB1